MEQSQIITSRENQRLKVLRSVRDGRVADMIFLEGVRLAEEAISSSVEIVEIFLSSDFESKERNIELARYFETSEIPLARVSHNLFRTISDTDSPQGIILVARRPSVSAKQLQQAVADAKLPVVVFLMEVNNPANLGAVARTCEAAGAAGIIVSTNSADPFSPKASRSAMGSNLRLPIWDEVKPGDALEWSSRSGFVTTAADIGTKKSYTEVDWKRPRLLVFGSEAHGLGRAFLEKLDEIICIPMENSVESLNLAVSSGIILFEAKRCT